MKSCHCRLQYLVETCRDVTFLVIDLLDWHTPAKRLNSRIKTGKIGPPASRQLKMLLPSCFTSKFGNVTQAFQMCSYAAELHDVQAMLTLLHCSRTH